MQTDFNKKISLDSQADLEINYEKAEAVLNSLQDVKFKTNFTEKFPTALHNMLVNLIAAQSIKDLQNDVVLEGKIYFRKFKLAVGKTTLVLTKADKDTKFEKEDYLIILGISEGKILCLVFDKKQRKNKFIVKTLKEHVKRGSELISMKEGIFSKLSKKMGLKAKFFTKKELKKIGNLRNPFKPLTKISNELIPFFGCFYGTKGFTFQDVANLFVFIHDEKSTVKEKAIELVNNIYVVKKSDQKKKKSKKK